MIKRHIVQGCCGSSAFIFETDKPIKKYQAQIFKDAGYLMPDHFYNSGQFYVQKNRLIANSSFGITRINVRCSGDDCEQKMKEFEELLEKAINL